MKAPFFKRLFAYIIDMLLIGILVTIICSALPNKNESIEKELKELSTEFMEKKIDNDEYISKYKDLMYQNNKNEKVPLGVNAVLVLAYFVIFQYMNKGQTLGKKALNLRVVDNETKKEVSILRGLLRSILPLNILSSFIGVVLIKLLTKNTYIDLYLGTNIFETVFIFITLFLILYKKDGRGLHDMMANTMVIEEKR